MEHILDRVFKGYQLREYIGAGGVGAVYRAYHVPSERDVAVKIIRSEYSNHRDFIRKFEIEAQQVARLEHPCIVPLYDYWRDVEGAFLAMRWLRGGNLRTVLAGIPWEVTEISRLLSEIAGALTTAHRQGIVHQRLKPENVLFDDDRHAYLSDFNIARDYEAEPGTTDNRDRPIAYCSPEQAKKERVTLQTDVYCLGLLLYELLAGRLLFQNDLESDQSSLDLTYLHESRPDLPAALNTVLQKATAHRPTDRYASALALAAAFNESVSHELHVSSTGRQNLLSDREISVLSLIAEGLPNREIAQRLSFSVDTIKWYLKQIYSKLDAHSRIQAIQRAQSLNLLKPIYAQPVILPTSPMPPDNFPSALENPYKGLRPFYVSDALDFFGRETLVRQLLTRMQASDTAHFLAVVGPSGSGKSSVVRAGLLPAIRDGALPGSDHWFIADILPGSAPLEALASSMMRLAINPPQDLLSQLRADARGLQRAVQDLLQDDDGQLLLIIDQFEELFTLVTDAAERLHFLDSILAAISDPASQLRVIITLRADFYDRPLEYPRFGELIESCTQLVLPLTPDELEQAIVGPARRVGTNVEAGLVSALVAESYEQPGALPLLQFALAELFDTRNGQELTLDAYRAIGGAMGALVRRADSLYEELDSKDQAVTRQLFLRLVTRGEGIEDTRRRSPQAELQFSGTDGYRIDEIVDLFCRYRLVTLDREPNTGNPTVEIAHESLIRTWGRLHEWLAASRADLQIHQRLMAATAEWISANREKSFLSAGTRLEQFEAWLESTTLVLNWNESDYIQASIAARKAEQAQNEAQKVKEAAAARLARNFRSTIGVLALIGSLLVIVMVILSLQATSALNQVTFAGQTLTPIPVTLTTVARTIAEGNTTMELLRLAAAANKLLLARNGNVETAALLGIRTLNTAYLPEADSALMRSMETMFTRTVFTGHSGAVYGVAFSPDGKMIASGSADSTVRLWDVTTRQVLHTLTGHTDSIYGVAFSPDGKYVLSGSKDHTARLWDVKTGRTVRIFGTKRNPIYLPGHFGPVDSIAFSPDGKYVLTGGDFTARLWDIQSGRNIRTFSPIERCAVFSVAYSPDGNYIALGCYEQVAQVWDARTAQPVQTFKGHSAAIWTLRFSPDGKRLLTGSGDGTARLWDIQTGGTVHTFIGHATDVQTVEFSPDGNYILTGSADQTARLWDVRTGQVVRTFSGHIGAVWSATFSPDGKQVLTGADDTMVRLWDASEDRDTQIFASHDATVRSVAFSPDNNLIASASDDHTVRLWDVQSRQQLFSVTEHGSAYAVVFSPDGKYILTGSDDETSRLWEVKTGMLIQSFVGNGTAGSIYGLAFSPDGKQLAMGGSDLIIRTWDFRTGQLLRTLTGHKEPVSSVAFSPDGKFLLSGSYDKTAYLWDLQTGQPIRTFAGHTSSINDVAFSPDGKYVSTGSTDTTARLWDVQTGQTIRVFSGHSDSINSIAFSPDGKSIVTSSADTTARLWDVQTGQTIRVFSGHSNAVNSADFSPDGKTLVTGGTDGTVRVWQVNFIDFIRYACSRLVRDFTDAERLHYELPDKNPTCPQFAQPATPAR